ncbi:MAG: hypothetical protein Q4G09_01725 [Clostridia bacterium]|nr:hypothetical protein [Clostridia bacterium]
MKKIAKSAILLLVMGMILILLTGCGGDKLVATKTTDDDEMFGKYEEKIEVSFKSDKVDKVKMTLKFEDSEKAESAYSMFNFATSMLEEEEKDGFKVKQDGKNINVEMSSEVYKDQEYLDDEDITKEAMKKSLEEQGYKVK